MGGGREVDLWGKGCVGARPVGFGCPGCQVWRGREGYLEGLGALAGGGGGVGVFEGRAVDAAGGVVFLFPGQGSQWEGMACGLLDSSPVFAAELGACEAALAEFVEWSVVDVLRGREGAPSLARIEVLQPVLWAVMVSLAGLWKACGVRARAVVGHSQGEIAAACVAGILSLGDAARLVVRRSAILSGLAGRGAVVSLAVGVGRAQELAGRYGGRVELAGVNGPASVVLAGDRDALDELLGECEREGIRAREVPATVASHTSRVEVYREELLDVCRALEPGAGEIEFFSTVTGGPLEGGRLDGEYWYRNMREPVQFERAVRCLLEREQRVFVEVSPHPVLLPGAQETIEAALGDSEAATVVGSLRRGEECAGQFLRAMGQLWVGGASVDWGALYSGPYTIPAGFPTYAFQRESYWLEGAPRGGALGGSEGVLEHPLLSAGIALADGEEWIFTGAISLQSDPWLADHAVLGVVLLPGTAFIELALRAGSEVGCPSIQELTLQTPLVLEQSTLGLQIRLGAPTPEQTRAIGIYARAEREDPEDQHPWVLHATGALAPQPQADSMPPLPLLSSWPPAGASAIDTDALYAQLEDYGCDYGPVLLKASRPRGCTD